MSQVLLLFDMTKKSLPERKKWPNVYIAHHSILCDMNSYASTITAINVLKKGY